jgi:hypothetical protein
VGSPAARNQVGVSAAKGSRDGPRQRGSRDGPRQRGSRDGPRQRGAATGRGKGGAATGGGKGGPRRAHSRGHASSRGVQSQRLVRESKAKQGWKKPRTNETTANWLGTRRKPGRVRATTAELMWASQQSARVQTSTCCRHGGLGTQWSSRRGEQQSCRVGSPSAAEAADGGTDPFSVELPETVLAELTVDLMIV